MAVIELAIDMGSSNTYIYQKGHGIVLREPSVVAVQSSTGNKTVRSVGTEAKKLIGKTPGDTTVVFPLFEGVIVSQNMATVMLKNYLGKIVPRGLFRPKVHALFTIPCGMSEKDKKVFEAVAFDSGISEVHFIEKVIASGLGVNMPISSARAGLVIDIGGGTTEIGVISMAGIISGFSLCLAGYSADTAIIDYIADNFGIKIGLASAEKIKINVGSLIERDNMTAVVSGIDISRNTPSTLEIKSRDIKDIMFKIYGKIFEVVEGILKVLPGETGSDILENGVYLSGGGSQIAGLEEFARGALGYPVNMAPDPTVAAALGAGKLISNQDLYNNFFLLKEQDF